MSDETVEIRRYPNRRLYDRSRRRYVTLKDIEGLVLQGKTIEVRDSRNGEDMTRQILTQILMDRYPQKMDMFPVAMLHNVLRANDFAMDLWRGYLRQSLAAMEAFQKAATPFASPFDWLSGFFPGLAAPPRQPEPAPASDAVARRLDELAERIERLESGGHSPHVHDGGGLLDRLEQRVHDLEDDSPGDDVRPAANVRSPRAG